MLRTLMTLIGMIALSSCAQSPKSKIEARCVADGQDTEQCACMADTMASSLTSEQLTRLADLIDNEDQALESLRGMSIADGRAMMQAVGNVADECGFRFNP